MASFGKTAWSNSTNGQGIKVVATATAGTLIHTAGAVTGDDNYDEIYLWAVNTSAAAVKLTIEFGGVTNPDHHIEQTISAESGLVLVLPGLILQNGLLVRAFAASANVLVLHGFINKIRA